MKPSSKFWASSTLALLCLPLLGQQATQPPPPPPPPSTSTTTTTTTSQHNADAAVAHPVDPRLFHEGETTLDLFGSVSVGQEVIENISGERVKDDGRLGAGVGLNHFPSRNLGIGIDAYTENTQHSFVDNTSANLIFRIPIDALHLAPYIFGGGGYQFDPSGLWFGQAGGGLEFRFARRFGLFADARYVFTDGTENFGVGRLGIRFGF